MLRTLHRSRCFSWQPGAWIQTVLQLVQLHWKCHETSNISHEPCLTQANSQGVHLYPDWQPCMCTGLGHYSQLSLTVATLHRNINWAWHTPWLPWLPCSFYHTLSPTDIYGLKSVGVLGIFVWLSFIEFEDLHIFKGEENLSLAFLVCLSRWMTPVI